jgi:hypothetical protein
MRLFFIVSILLFQNQAQAPNIQKEARGPQSSESKSAQVSTVSTSIGSGDKETPAHRAEDTNTYDPRKDCLYRWYMRATIIGVLGGIGGVGVLLWQSTLLRRSVEATEKAAHAASDNVNAFIATEASILYAEDVQFMNDTRPHFRYRVGVAGKTNCRIFFEAAQLMVSYSEDAPPAESFYENPQASNFPVELIAIPEGVYPAEFAGYLPDHRSWETGEWRTIQAGLEFMWACGLFRYRDAFKREYERRFCYKWEPNPTDPRFRAFRHSKYSRVIDLTGRSAPVKPPVPFWRRAVDWYVARIEAMKNGESKND